MRTSHRACPRWSWNGTSRGSRISVWGEVVSSLSFISNFDAISKGVLDLVNLIYFVSVIALFLFINVVLVNLLKAR